VLFRSIKDLTAVSGAALREAKQRLALEATTLAHGRAVAERAAAAARALFGGGGEAAVAEVPAVTLPRARFEAGISALDLLVAAGLTASRNEARRLIRQGGAYLNDRSLEERTVTVADLREGAALLRAGKKRYRRVVAE
jgi:tyrosyl-tRNA synthetase